MILPRMAYFSMESKRTADHLPPVATRHFATPTVPYTVMQLKHLSISFFFLCVAEKLLE
jgi:hypothetical protein